MELNTRGLLVCRQRRRVWLKACTDLVHDLFQYFFGIIVDVKTKKKFLWIRRNQ